MGRQGPDRVRDRPSQNIVSMDIIGAITRELYITGRPPK